MLFSVLVSTVNIVLPVVVREEQKVEKHWPEF